MLLRLEFYNWYAAHRNQRVPVFYWIFIEISQQIKLIFFF